MLYHQKFLFRYKLLQVISTLKLNDMISQEETTISYFLLKYIISLFHIQPSLFHKKGRTIEVNSLYWGWRKGRRERKLSGSPYNMVQTSKINSG